jgi:hypothetical protein
LIDSLHFGFGQLTLFEQLTMKLLASGLSKEYAEWALSGG